MKSSKPWTKPTTIDIPTTMEVAAYRCAELKDLASTSQEKREEK